MSTTLGRLAVGARMHDGGTRGLVLFMLKGFQRPLSRPPSVAPDATATDLPARNTRPRTCPHETHDATDLASRDARRYDYGPGLTKHGHGRVRTKHTATDLFARNTRPRTCPHETRPRTCPHETHDATDLPSRNARLSESSCRTIRHQRSRDWDGGLVVWEPVVVVPAGYASHQF